MENIENSEGTPREVAEQTLKSIDKCFQNLKPNASIEERIAFAIEHDISDRAGFKHLWLSLSSERRFHINNVWQEIVRLEVDRLRQQECSPYDEDEEWVQLPKSDRAITPEEVREYMEKRGYS